MKNFYCQVRLIAVFIFSLLLLFSSDFAFAQNTTKQRTTGTYLPANAATVRRDTTVQNGQKTDISLPDGTLTLNIPEKLYSGDIRFSIAKITHRNNSAVPALKIDGEDFVSNEVYEITATDTNTDMPVLNFSQSFTITFRYLDQDIANFDESKTTVRYFDRIKQQWTAMDVNRDTDSNTISVNSDHLTLFAITAPITSTSIINQNSSQTQTSGTPFWFILVISLIVLTIIGFGGWYIYVNYLHAYFDQNNFSEQSVFGGSEDQTVNQSSSTEKYSSTPPSPGSQNKPAPPSSDSPTAQPTNDPDNPNSSKSDQEIWIDF